MQPWFCTRSYISRYSDLPIVSRNLRSYTGFLAQSDLEVGLYLDDVDRLGSFCKRSAMSHILRHYRSDISTMSFASGTAATSPLKL
jgi:hypothetical protein